MGGSRGETEDPDSWDQHGWDPLPRKVGGTALQGAEEPVAYGVMGQVCGWTWPMDRWRLVTDGEGACQRLTAL